MARIRSNLGDFKKYPAVGRLVVEPMMDLGLAKHDRLIAGGSLSSPRDLDDVWVLPVTLVFIRVGRQRFETCTLLNGPLPNDVFEHVCPNHVHSAKQCCTPSRLWIVDPVETAETLARPLSIASGNWIHEP